VKWVRSGPAQARTEPWRLRTELATLQFLSDDLERLAAFARARGELSAATAGRARTYRDRCTALGFPAPAGDAKRRLAGLWDRGDEDAAALGAPIAGPVASELTAVIEELNAPGPFLALSHGDAQSNNILVRESGPADARLIDFEDAGYAHALTDAVCLHARSGVGIRPVRRTRHPRTGRPQPTAARGDTGIRRPGRRSLPRPAPPGRLGEAPALLAAPLKKAAHDRPAGCG